MSAASTTAIRPTVASQFKFPKPEAISSYLRQTPYTEAIDAIKSFANVYKVVSEHFGDKNISQSEIRNNLKIAFYMNGTAEQRKQFEHLSVLLEATESPDGTNNEFNESDSALIKACRALIINDNDSSDIVKLLKKEALINKLAVHVLGAETTILCELIETSLINLGNGVTFTKP